MPAASPTCEYLKHLATLPSRPEDSPSCDLVLVARQPAQSGTTRRALCVLFTRCPQPAEVKLVPEM